MPLTRVSSTLPDELEALTGEVIGCCLAVHRGIGPGMTESVYVRACCAEFSAQGIAYEREKLTPIMYRGDLRALSLRAGLVVNFNVELLRQGIRRVVL